jgi:NAD-dependent DNA ligase
MKLTDAAQKLEFSYNSLHSAPLDSYLTGLLFVTDLCGYKVTNIDMKIIDSFNSRSPKTVEKFNPIQLKTNGCGDEVCLTGFTDQEKKKFGEFLAEKGFKVRGNVTSNLRILITPSGSYTRSPAKEAEAIRVGARIMDLNSLIHRLA